MSISIYVKAKVSRRRVFEALHQVTCQIIILRGTSQELWVKGTYQIHLRQIHKQNGREHLLISKKSTYFQENIIIINQQNPKQKNLQSTNGPNKEKQEVDRNGEWHTGIKEKKDPKIVILFQQK